MCPVVVTCFCLLVSFDRCFQRLGHTVCDGVIYTNCCRSLFVLQTYDGWSRLLLILFNCWFTFCSSPSFFVAAQVLGFVLYYWFVGLNCSCAYLDNNCSYVCECRDLQLPKKFWLVCDTNVLASLFCDIQKICGFYHKYSLCLLNNNHCKQNSWLPLKSKLINAGHTLFWLETANYHEEGRRNSE